MTLAEWAVEAGIVPTQPTTERSAVSVVIDQTNPHRPWLYRLDDYVVSSVSGIVVWLTPRRIA